MSELNLRRVTFTSEADVTLKMLKARTGVTPNVLCRLGVCLSFDEPGRPRRVERVSGPVPREINRYTLLGEYDPAIVALLRTRCAEDGVDRSEMDEEFSAHLHRGIQLLSGRLRSLTDLDGLAGQRAGTGV